MIEVLSRLVSERGAPAFLRSDNGPEFIAKSLKLWDWRAERLRREVHRSWQPVAERPLRELQRQVPR